jgi:hypothetical protein
MDGYLTVQALQHQTFFLRVSEAIIIYSCVCVCVGAYYLHFTTVFSLLEALPQIEALGLLLAF